MCVCVSVSLGLSHFYYCALYTHFTAKYSENVFYANICTKNVRIMAKERFGGAYGVFCVCVASALNMCKRMLQKNLALNAFRTSTIIPQYMTRFAME